MELDGIRRDRTGLSCVYMEPVEMLIGGRSGTGQKRIQKGTQKALPVLDPFQKGLV